MALSITFSCNSYDEDEFTLSEELQSSNNKVKAKVYNGILTLDSFDDFMYYYNELDKGNELVISELNQLNYSSLLKKNFLSKNDISINEFYSNSISRLFNSDYKIIISGEVITLNNNKFITKDNLVLGRIVNHDLNTSTKRMDIFDLRDWQQNYITGSYNTGATLRRMYCWMRNEAIVWNGTYTSSKIKLAIALQHHSRSLWTGRWYDSSDVYRIGFSSAPPYQVTDSWIYASDIPMTSYSPTPAQMTIVQGIQDYVLASANLKGLVNNLGKDYDFYWSGQLWFYKQSDNGASNWDMYDSINIEANWQE
ncbi:hypothetical protein NMK71_11440 [Weeksellaceae bacterium KMM 9713]|uniref:Uncharacterized protein n=1 Tax=Profundicola chukchiensis TaxID=2961959 RepID=A0A9X4RWF4_9FLAO|nr:hypothetical protein [Profundicola chukchiensis]MDG4947025.1 hypothetical protein [Profundicola chukchiensis]MDG4949365.1 hypothetical protein [Profundicola chukchiensis]